MSEGKNKNLNVVYLHGRPSAHSLHSSLAASVAKEFKFVDSPVRWQDKNRHIIFDILSWVLNAFLFKDKKKYDIFLVDNLHVTPIIMRKLGLISKKQKLIVHMGSHTLYFMYSGRFASLNLRLHKYALRNYDAILCEGMMAKELSVLLLKEQCPPAYVTFIGPHSHRIKELQKQIPDLSSNNIIIIGSGPAQFRMFYKGLDLMIKSFDRAFSRNKALKLTVVGNWNREIIDYCLKDISMAAAAAINFTGVINDTGALVRFISGSALCIHCTRGDAFPTSTMEVMAAGVPVLVSEWTGTKEIVKNISTDLISPLNEESISEKILWYFALSNEAKIILSNASREAVKNFTEENAILHYQRTFEKITEELQINDW
ncbi:MAG TPA: glycosyltransferase family 4 protein [Bacteroidia bacterium]|jgi:glycosyltransferase involved in cell wall biosynthesis